MARETLEVETRRAETLAGRLGAASDLIASLRGDIQSLTEHMLQLKREGFALPPSIDRAPVEQPGFPVPVIEAIDARAFDTPTRRLLERYAMSAMQRGDDPEAIAASILDGDSPDLD